MHRPRPTGRGPVVVVLAVEKYEKLTGEQISPSQDKSEN